MIEFDEYNILFPGFRSVEYSGSCVIKEIEAKDHGYEVREVTFNKISNGVMIPHEVLKMTTSVYAKLKAPNFLYHDCDGVFCYRDSGMLVINLCELKTTANANAVGEATDQILCSYVKLRMLLSHLQSFDGNVRIRGFIVAHKPSIAQKSMLKRPANFKERFLSHLLSNKTITLNKQYLENELYPIKMEPINFYFVEVQNGHQSTAVDYSRL